MNHLVRTEAKRIYQKIRRTLSSEDAENISENVVIQRSPSLYPDTEYIKSSNQN